MNRILPGLGIAAACLLLSSEGLPIWALSTIIAAGAVVCVPAWYIVTIRRVRDVEEGREL
jgi:hypothetical protein